MTACLAACSLKDRPDTRDCETLDAYSAQGECLPYQGKGQSAAQLRLRLFGKIYPVLAKWFSYPLPQRCEAPGLYCFHPRPQALLATGRSEVSIVFSSVFFLLVFFRAS